MGLWNRVVGGVAIVLLVNGLGNAFFGQRELNKMMDFYYKKIETSEDVKELEALSGLDEHKEFQRLLKQKKNKVEHYRWMQEVHSKRADKYFSRAYVYGWFK